MNHRTREEIEKEIKNPNWTYKEILEVLLDIRDELHEMNKVKINTIEGT